MPTPSDAPGASFPDDPARQESAAGGADAVEKTTYVVGRGTEPEARRGTREGAPSAGGGGGKLIAAVLAIVVIGGLVYAIAM